jgi:hypothetical protein
MNETNSVPSKKPKVGAYVPTELKKKAHEYVEAYRTSESQLVVELLEMFLALRPEALHKLSVIAAKERRTVIQQAGTLLESAIDAAED